LLSNWCFLLRPSNPTCSSPLWTAPPPSHGGPGRSCC
jgi:hypothetical protein